MGHYFLSNPRIYTANILLSETKLFIHTWQILCMVHILRPRVENILTI